MKQFFLNNKEIESVFNNRPLEYESPYSLKDLIQKAKTLNEIDINIDKSKSIAVIGNSGKLLNQNYGKLINKHDYVIRCNLALVSGYEKFVGEKTDFRVIAGKSFWRDLSEHFSSYDNNFLSELEKEHFIIKANPLYHAIQGIIKNYNTKSYIHFLKQNFVDELEKTTNINDVSTGFCAIALAMQNSDNVSIFGFNFFEEEWKSQHYFEEIKPYNRGHSIVKEKEYINYLIDNDFIKSY
jgi:hypothetical protein